VFFERGQRRVGLGVDATNPTGATRLYERAGMRVAYESISFAKELPQ
jgi:mycothiol synthase